MATGVGRGKMQLAAFDGPSSKTPPIGAKISQKISCASRVRAHFVPNFVAMAMWVSRGKMQLSAFDGASSINPYRHKESPKNLLYKPSYSPFCPKFCCHGNQGRSRVKLNDTVRFAIPENPVSYTHLTLPTKRIV